MLSDFPSVRIWPRLCLDPASMWSIARYGAVMFSMIGWQISGTCQNVGNGNNGEPKRAGLL